TFVSLTQNTGPVFNCTGTSTVTCTIASFTSGASAQFTLTVSPGLSLSGTLAITATISLTNPVDPSSANNSSTATSTVGCPTIGATPSALGYATFGIAFSQTFTMTGGTAPATFSMIGTLPSGMSFSGASLTGAPSQRGAFPVTLRTTDNNG